MSTSDRRDFVRNAARYLQKHQQRSGKFIYRARPDKKKVRRDYNVLRHAGTLYALCQANEIIDDDLGDTIDRGLEFLWRWYLVPIPAEDMQYAIAAARPGKSSYDITKIGSMGLAVIAASSLSRDLTPFERDACAGLVRYARSLIRPDGSMISKLNYRTGEVSDFVSLYYPGEVSLGMLLYGVRFGDQEATDTAVRIIEHLADIRKDDYRVPADHWALLATSKAFELARSGKLELSEDLTERLYFHATQVIGELLRTAEAAQTDIGSLVSDGHCCAIGTRLEGMTAMQPWLKERGYAHIEQLDFFIEMGIAYVIEAQYRKGDLKGGVPWVSPHHPHYSPDDQSPEVRIDTVQHNISAVLGGMALEAAED
ncbi:MAG: hypothetical protein HKP40_04895 [Litoreibacter sp.]|nr:hypothetical protein [Litoreibacter sp.]